MKGVIFIALNEMVETELGIDVWEKMLEKSNLPSEGIYTSVSTYADAEIFNLVTALSELSHKSVNELVALFGKYLFNFMYKKYPYFIDNQPDFIPFLAGIDGVIHKEVRKLYIDANLPSIEVESISDQLAIMHYSSPKKLCLLAEGLIQGAANHYHKTINIEHKQCMHNGAHECILAINIQ